MVLFANRVSANFPPEKRTSTSSALESFWMRSKVSAAWSGVSIQDLAVSLTFHELLNALPTLTFLNLAGAAPWPVPITCCGCPLPQFGVPHSVHSSREQIASIEFQKSVVIPEYDGFFSVRTRLPFLISQPISQPNWKL